jgi:hypothetical protein
MGRYSVKSNRVSGRLAAWIALVSVIATPSARTLSRVQRIEYVGRFLVNLPERFFTRL